LDIEPETGNLLQTRPAIGGNVLATIKTPDHRPQMATVRPHSTRPAPAQQNRTGMIQRHQPDEALLASRVRRVDFQPFPDEKGVQDADVVVAVGRGMKKADNLPVAQGLADVLGAAIGATRDVVDRGWVDYAHQIGLSGKTVTPRLYVGAGASGSIQHLAGMQTAESIVAVNTDADAQIFRVADLGIVGDMMAVLPAMTEAVRRAREPDAAGEEGR
jgi:electron transfer flavoprotein alpha subunit